MARDDIRSTRTSRPVADDATVYREENTAYPETQYAGYRDWERDDAKYTAQVVTASGLNILAGIWLIIAPWVLNYSDSSNAVWNQVAIGAVIAVLAVARVAAPYRFEGLSWVNAVLGLWLIVAPFVLVYDQVSSAQIDRIYANDIILGVIVLALAVWSAMATRKAKDDDDVRTNVGT